jgi:hypothetical protein
MASASQGCPVVAGVWGDVTNDGSINVIDAQQIARFSVGLVVSFRELMARGDVTGDGAINVIDAQQVARASVGLSAAARIRQSVTEAQVVAGVTVAPATANVPVGGTVTLTASPVDLVGNSLASCAAVGWQSSDVTLATVSGIGVVTGVAAGRAIITATSGDGKRASATVDVQAGDLSLVFDHVPTQVGPGMGLGVVVRATRTGADTVSTYAGTVTLADASGATSLLGTPSVAARNGVAVFDEVALTTVGTYRLVATGSTLRSATSGDIVVSTTSSLPTITIGTIQRTVVTVGTPGSARYRIPITLLDGEGVPVGPTRVTTQLARGTGTIVSGATTLTTSGGAGTFDLVIQGSEALDLAVAALGFQTRIQAIDSPSEYWSTYMSLSRASADSVIPAGGRITLTGTLRVSSLASSPVHTITYELTWNPDQLTLSADTTTASASYSINRSRVEEGAVRVTVASATPLGGIGQSVPLHRFIMTAQPGAAGVQSVRVTALELLGSSGEVLAPRRSIDVTFRIP